MMCIQKHIDNVFDNYKIHVNTLQLNPLGLYVLCMPNTKTARTEDKKQSCIPTLEKYFVLI
jgi:hypothetical protein